MINIMLIISWFVVGLICMICVWINDMRGKKYNEDYFNKSCIGTSICIFLLGYISPFIIYITFTQTEKYFTKFIYKVANISVKTKTSNKK